MERQRTKVPKGVLAAYSELVQRMAFAARLGLQYDGDRDLYSALGYPTDIHLDDYVAKYRRLDIANAIIKRPVNATWKGPIQVLETTKSEDTQFERAFQELSETLGLKSKFKRADRLTGLSHYGVMLLGLDDVQTSTDFINPVKEGKRKLLYVKPFGEANATISSYVTDAKNPRYGLPLTYGITVTNTDGTNSQTIQVHYSRVIHIVDDPDENEYSGNPRLEVIYNRLMDLEKLVGGSSEMYWRNARPGYTGKVDPNFQMSLTDREALKTQVDEFEHNLRRIFINEGIDLQALTQAIHDPEKHVDVQLMMISAVTNIPKRILTGSERGELASTQDRDEWASYIQDRRDDFAEVCIVRPFINACIKYGVLPKPINGYKVMWMDMFAPSEKDKAEIGKIRSESLKNYVGQALSPDSVVPPEAFFQLFLGFSPEQIELIMAMSSEGMIRETENTTEEHETENQTQE